MAAEAKQIVVENVWSGLYGESWKGLICDEAFAHPAKFSRALIRRIYDHVVEEGWAKSGDRVIDPFGGVALGGFDAMRHGLYWHGCELEEKFVGLGNSNIVLWNERFSRMPNWGVARLLQGDSRRLTAVWAGNVCCVTSPPYADGCAHTGGDDPKPEHLKGGAFYGVGISSPPYSESMNRAGGIDGEKSEHVGGPHSQMNRSDTRYGSSDGQLGAMKEGDHSISISSPPWEKGAEGGLRKEKFKDPTTFAKKMAAGSRNNGGHGASAEAYLAQIERDAAKTYGDTEGQLGQQDGETFWSASRLILQQLRQVIVPGGHAVFVVKAFVRDKQIVDFPAQWAQLCEVVGFRLLHHHRASLVENSGTQRGFEQDKEITVERKSFFRRLAEKKGSPRIDHESVLCFERT